MRLVLKELDVFITGVRPKSRSTGSDSGKACSFTFYFESKEEIGVNYGGLTVGAGRGSRTPKTRSPADFEADGSESEDELNE
jgi:hypothetical protein